MELLGLTLVILGLAFTISITVAWQLSKIIPCCKRKDILLQNEFVLF